jgi:uncharacterized protein
MKFVVLALIVAVLGWLFFGLQRKTSAPARKERGEEEPGASAGTSAASATQVTMVRCAHCGVHMPVTEAIVDAQGRHYCCAEHRERGPSNEPTG